MEDVWYLYIIECKSSEFYVGISKDVEKRVKLHNTGKACKYTSCRFPVELRYTEFCGPFGDARRREIAVKKLTRKQKEELIEFASEKKAVKKKKNKKV
jgi:putative endonuclease